MCNDVMNEENLILKTVPGPSLHNQHLSQKTTDHNFQVGFKQHKKQSWSTQLVQLN